MNEALYSITNHDANVLYYTLAHTGVNIKSRKSIKRDGTRSRYSQSSKRLCKHIEYRNIFKSEIPSLRHQKSTNCQMQKQS